jgi:hypothetical protein
VLQCTSVGNTKNHTNFHSFDYISNTLQFNYNKPKFTVHLHNLFTIQVAIKFTLRCNHLEEWLGTWQKYDWFIDVECWSTRFQLISWLLCWFKKVGSWAFQFHYIGCYNLLLTGLIPTPLVQTYCTFYWTQSKNKKMCQFKFWKGFVGTIFWGGRLL